MNTGPSKVAFVIPVHNRRETTLQCLRSLARIDLTDVYLRIFIVDDGSTDGTSDAIRSEFPDVELVDGNGSLHYAAGTNRGISAAMDWNADFVVTMNDDAVYHEQFLQRMLAAARANDRSVVGALLMLWDEPHKVFQVDPHWNTLKGGWAFRDDLTAFNVRDKTFPVEMIVGNCVMFPAQAIRECGFMDEKNFPHGWGDAQYTVRIRNAGWNLIIEPRALVWCEPNTNPTPMHQQSLGQLLRSLFVNERNPQNLKRQFVARWYSAPSKVGAIIAFLAYCLSLIRKALTGAASIGVPDRRVVSVGVPIPARHDAERRTNLEDIQANSAANDGGGTSRDARRSSLLILYVFLVSIACGPIWLVPYYFNQDGTPHLYNAYLITELLKGNAAVAEFAAFNSFPVPNMAGHWLLAPFVLLLPPVVATKAFTTLLFAAFVAAMAWLRYQARGREGMATTLLLSAVIAFNWMWFIGFYNFILGCTLFAFTLGLWWRWRDGLSPRRALAIFFLVVLTYLSHLIPFAVLLFAMAVLRLFDRRSTDRRAKLWTGAIIVFSLPMALGFVLSRPPGGEFGVHWRYMPDVVTQLSSADPFAIISRLTLPFTSANSAWLSLLSPLPWIVLAIALLLSANFQWMKKPFAGWLGLAVLMGLVWIVGPDDFGSEHGAYLRERCLILGLICLVPFIGAAKGPLVDVARACLIFVLVYQMLAMTEYAIRTHALARDFVAARDAIGSSDSLASVTFIPEIGRFKSIPETNITPYLGIGKNGAVWDNYELGLDIFPLVAKTPAQQRFIKEFRENSTFNPRDTEGKNAEKLAKLNQLLAEHHDAIDVLLVWHERAEFVGLTAEWFQPEPYFVSGPLKLYRHR